MSSMMVTSMIVTDIAMICNDHDTLQVQALNVKAIVVCIRKAMRIIPHTGS